jgi:urease accessory protein
MTVSSHWLLLQLADASFPSGGFAHSGGLEAAMVLGSLDARDPTSAVSGFLDASLRQAGRAALPFVRAAALDPGRLEELDDAYDATLPLQATNRASRAQGRALASAASRVWEAAESALAPTAQPGRPSHHAPVFGAIFGVLGVPSDETLATYLHNAARGLLSASVRLGLLGPLEAQRLLASRAPLLDTVLGRGKGARPQDAAQTAPRIELYSALHDRLDGRMFQS